MRVTWSPLANEQVDDAVAYISQDNQFAAVEWLERLLDRVRSLASFPDSGRMVPETQREDIRAIIVSPFRSMSLRPGGYMGEGGCQEPRHRCPAR